MNITDILDKFASLSPTVREKGKLFEKFIREYYRVSPSSDLKEVWLWSDWPLKQTPTDIGIDLVGKTALGEYWAIQCKFFDPKSTISKPDIDSFLAASGKTFLDETGAERQFAFRQVVATCPLGPTAQATLNGQNPPAGCLNALDFDFDGIDWSAFWNEFDRAYPSVSPSSFRGLAADNPETPPQPAFQNPAALKLPVKQLRKHQQCAYNDVLEGFKNHDRGKLIMACGTGKTFTALRIAEGLVPPGGTVLYLVPSLALIAQTLRSWTVDAQRPIQPMLVCSDAQVHEQDARRKNLEDETVLTVSNLAHPATTRPEILAERWKKLRDLAVQNGGENAMTVIFSTYQSLQVVSDAQRQCGLPPFDLIVCDEAHRTTGVSLSEADESAFTKVHKNDVIAGTKRLYMTATPRIYMDSVKQKAQEEGLEVLCSMDDETIFGPVFHWLSFGKAVEDELLTEYKVVILAISQSHARQITSSMTPEQLQERRAFVKGGADDEEKDEILVDDIAKILGCWQGLSKKSKYIGRNGKLTDDFTADPVPMRRAVAFCSTIKNSRDVITPMFRQVVAAAQANGESLDGVRIEMEHVDGSFQANLRQERLNWLNAEPEPGVCRVLSNVRCLSEGVDVPALDAILFLAPRKSEVDVIQSLGRVMRRAPGKNFGYVILPIVIPEDSEPENILDKNDRYKVVWQILRSLRAHDERFRVKINKIQFNDGPPEDGPIAIGGDFAQGEAKTEPGTESVTKKKKKDAPVFVSGVLPFGPEQISKLLYAKIVKKCGDRDYLDQWAQEIAQIAESQIGQIRRMLQNPTDEQRAAFEKFVLWLQTEINPSVDEDQALELLTQHLVTKPVFDALFARYSFVKKNVVSQAMQAVLDAFNTEMSDEDKKKLDEFNASIRYKVEGITSSSGKQKVITKLYDQFFRLAFPKVAERLGIVYTPIEVVDFIIQSVEYVLKTEFGKSLNNRSVHVLDPFTGTGTFIVRLLQSGIIQPNNLTFKYNRELHANEIVLLAYYIAAINIEEAYHGAREQQAKDPARVEYKPFPGIILTDTFQMEEKQLPDEAANAYIPGLDYSEDDDNDESVENNERIVRQRKAPIEVIFGNPPYSVGQTSANDNNQNQKYPRLDSRVENTYAAKSVAANKNSLYDSYIKAFRWASDRIKNRGVVAFVSNGSYIDNLAMDGFRKCLADEFNKIYVFNLRGNQRTSGELSRKEGGKIFGSGSRAPIAITILVKTGESNTLLPCDIRYCDIGDYLKREDKLAILQQKKSVFNVQWTKITPNEHGDWINQRCEEYANYIPLGAKKSDDPVTFFEDCYSRGVATARDAWCYNFSKDAVHSNMRQMTDFYNEQREAFQEAKAENPDLNVEQFIDTDPTKISWNRGLLNDLRKGKDNSFNQKLIRASLYRPFCNQYLYFDKNYNDMVYQIPKLFPTPKTPNLVIGVESPGGKKDFSLLITNVIPDLHLMAATQCFPLYYYESSSGGLDLNERETIVDGYVRRNAITDEILARFAALPSGPGELPIAKEDIFYFVYGYLHDPKYRQQFASDLKKALPRLPIPDRKLFWKYSRLGRQLAALHVNYESVPPLPEVPLTVANVPNLTEKQRYHVQKMTFAKKGKDADKSTIVVNPYITVSLIPNQAYEYVVNGKSAIEWIMERYAVTTNKDSGIVNDPNLYSDDPKYIVNLLLSVIAVSVKTQALLSDTLGA